MKRYKQTGIIVLTSLLVISLALFLPSCRKIKEAAKERQMEKLKAEKTEGCLNFTGVWDTNNGELQVLQRGCEAEGTLVGIGGGLYNLTGTVTNDTWDFKWNGPAGTGRGYFTMDPAGIKFIGENGDGENNTGRGTWGGTMIR
jgi:hypothetical protein